MARRCVWSRSLENEEAKARYRTVKIQPLWVVTAGEQTNKQTNKQTSLEYSCDTLLSFLEQLCGQFLTQNLFLRTHITATLQDTFNEQRTDKEIGKYNSRTMTLCSLSPWQPQLTMIRRHYFIWQLSLVPSRRLAELKTSMCNEQPAIRGVCEQTEDISGAFFKCGE